MRYSKYLFIALFCLIVTKGFSQTNDDWKNKYLYTGLWLGFGTDFSMGAHADLQFFDHFSTAIEIGISDNLYPTIALFPKAVFRPWKMEIGVGIGPQFGYHVTYGALWGLIFSIDVGYHLGPGVLYAHYQDGMGYSFGIGYKIGFFDRKK
jgi:hypothetical protein